MDDFTHLISISNKQIKRVSSYLKNNGIETPNIKNSERIYFRINKNNITISIACTPEHNVYCVETVLIINGKMDYESVVRHDDKTGTEFPILLEYIKNILRIY